jgi:hypothetical protein
LDKEIFEKQFKSKGEIRKSANGRFQLKNQNEEGPNSKMVIATVRATVPSFSALQNSKW